MRRAVSDQGLGEEKKVTTGRGAIGVGAGAIDSRDHEGDGAGAIAFVRADPAALRTPAAVELARHDCTKVLARRQIAFCRGLEKPPVRRMDGDGRFQKPVDFVEAAELAQTANRLLQVGAHAVGLGLRVEG